MPGDEPSEFWSTYVPTTNSVRMILMERPAVTAKPAGGGGRAIMIWPGLVPAVPETEMNATETPAPMHNFN